MTVRIRETGGMNGSEGTEAEATLLFEVRRAPSDTMADVRAAIIAETPSTFDGLTREKYSWQEEEDTLRLKVSVNYSSKLPESTLRRGFDGTGGTIRVYNSQNTVKFAPSGRTAPDFAGLIGIRDGDPEGVDITIPALKLNYRYKWPANVINNAYVKSMAGLIGTTNTATWDTYGAGELLFLGLQGEIVDNLPCEVSYAFAASADVSGLTIGAIASVAKGGHDYLWVAYEEDTDATAKKKIKKPLGAYVERVYRRAAFSALGLGL